MPSSIERIARRVVCCAGIAAGAVALAAMGGCNIVGPMGFLVGGEEKVDAQYRLPADRPAVVFVDDRSSVLPSRAARSRVAQAAEQTLLSGGAAGKSDIISSEAISPVLGAERFARPTGIAEVGTAVGAKTVVYATIDRFALSPNGAEFSPTATARVKVVDAETKQRLFPDAPEEWYTLSFTMPVRQGDVPKTDAERARAEAELADRLGVMIGRIFVKHDRRDPNPRIGQ